MRTLDSPPPTRSHAGEYPMLSTDFGRPIEILLVEDSPTDARLTKEALREGRMLNNIRHVEEGEEAIAILRRQGKEAEAPRPDLILLDLQLPGMDGREVLEEIKQDPDLRRIPVVIMTSSQAERDMLDAYNRHANCYVTKPVDVHQFIDAVKKIEDFWFTVVKLPAA